MTDRAAPLALLTPPAEPYRTAKEIADIVFQGQVSVWWVLQYCPREQLSPRKVLFLESRVRAWAARQHVAVA